MIAYQLYKDYIKRVNIYTDSKYIFRVSYGFGMLWRQRVFLTSAGIPTQNGQVIEHQGAPTSKRGGYYKD